MGSMGYMFVAVASHRARWGRTWVGGRVRCLWLRRQDAVGERVLNRTGHHIDLRLRTHIMRRMRGWSWILWWFAVCKQLTIDWSWWQSAVRQLWSGRVC